MLGVPAFVKAFTKREIYSYLFPHLNYRFLAPARCTRPAPVAPREKRHRRLFFPKGCWRSQRRYLDLYPGSLHWGKAQRSSGHHRGHHSRGIVRLHRVQGRQAVPFPRLHGSPRCAGARGLGVLAVHLDPGK